MFTGIIEYIGTIKSVSRGRIVVGTRLEDIAAGDSVAVDGVCLTARSVEISGAVTFDVSPETLSRTALGSLSVGDRVNVERAVRAGGRLGGHIVSGHVDTLGKVRSVRKDGGFIEAVFAAPTRYIVEKGSVAVNGVSLTVASLDDARREFRVAIVPHTLAGTTLGALAAGSSVNIEYDFVAKYLEKYAGKYGSSAPPSRPSNITKEKLKNAGF
ncbi:MAG: riboflavin synthase [Endomicrobiia bacterium]|nr:riboflavin synthase [Endomicrobiia bacterium]